MPRVLVVSFCNINTPSSGGKRRLEELVAAFAPDHALAQPAPAHPRVSGAPYPYDLGRRKRGINWGIFNLFLPANRRAVAQAVARGKPEAIVLGSIWCLPAFRRCSLPLFLDAQNVDALAVAERFGERHPFTRMVARQERAAVGAVRQVFCCSEVDAAEMRRRYDVPADRLTLAPNGATPRAPDAAADAAADARMAEWRGRCVLFFMGKLDYAPNAEAVEFLRGRLLPELERRAPGRFACLVSGGPAPAGTSPPNLRFLGVVPSVEPWLRRADICLAPVVSGSGTRLKILEYLAASRATLATDKAAEGLAGRNEKELLIRPPEQFADAILDLAGQPARRAALGAAGRELVARRYAWSATADIWRRTVTAHLALPS